MVFETKKIQTETLGEYLRAVRKAFNLSLEASAQNSGVNLKLLEVLESGNMSKLPADVYVRGALKQLAEAYKLDEEDLVRQYKKERQISRKLGGKEKFNVQQLSNFWKKLIITPKVLVFAAAGIFIFFTLAYLFWQVSSINTAPDLQIFSPKDQEIIKSLSVEVLGQADPGSNASVNGHEIFVDNEGKFKAEISLTPGPQEIGVVAKNRYGKQTQKNIKVFIQPESSEKNNQEVVLSLHFLGEVSISFLIDSKPLEKKDFKAGENFEIKSNENIILSASNGGLIEGSLNGQNLGVLGKKDEPLNGVSFSLDSTNINE